MEAQLHQIKEAYRKANPRSAAAFESACQHMPGGGTRTTLAVDPFPLYVKSGKGAILTDLDDHEYIDFVSDFTSGIYGKTNEALHNEIRSALEQGIQLGAQTRQEQELAELICKRFASIDSVRFTNSGTEATHMALMTAIRYTQRSKILVFNAGYHGTGFSGFVTDEDGILTGEHLTKVATLRAPYDFLVCPYNDLEAAKRKARLHEGQIAAILVEPMLGAGGAIPGDTTFLRGLRELANEKGSLIILDEIQTARLHYTGRQGQLGIVPDLTLLGKFFGGGFAFGAFGGATKIMQMYDSRRSGAAIHGGTFNNSVLTMAAGAYAAKNILTAEALDSLNKRGDDLRSSLNAIFSKNGDLFEVTGLGSINQIHCKLGGCQATQGLQLLYFHLLRRGFWIAQRGLLSLSFAISSEDIDGFVEAVLDSLACLPSHARLPSNA